ncbi:MAG TPA: aspartate aminotransferase family protein, partial [Longimicrobiaceae bacterium]|nr:aspartate aminotransferase family protein [Longimicrobiaceae bacterium]
MSRDLGRLLPEIRVPPPGPRSRALAAELRRHESPNVTYLGERFPVFWSEAQGSNVRDVDGNVYVDLTAAFGVAAAGHGHPAIVAAVTSQAERLLHGMGDVHPPEIKVELLRRLSEVAPGALSRTILANSGAEAVEAALKTVLMATGKPKVLAFEGGYHGLTLGALSVSGREDFRGPFRRQLADIAVLVPYPCSRRAGGDTTDPGFASLQAIEGVLAGPSGGEIGAILAEPIQGRGGYVIPPPGWLAGVRRICDERGILLVLDEIYTGFGRTGRWFACEHAGVVPDLLVVGKALTGGLPFAACIGTDEVMGAWPASRGEALHTSTFLGHPLGCAAALASIEILRRERLVERSATEGEYLLARLRATLGDHPKVTDVRGM